MKRTLLLIGILALCVLSGCAYMSTTNAPLSINDIEGTWEGLHFGFCYLVVEGPEKGKMVFLLNEKDYEVYEIQAISFSTDRFVMLLNIYDEKDDFLKIEGRLIGPNMISLSEIDDNSKESEDVLFLLRESYVPELRKKAKNIIKEILEKNT